MKKRNIFHRILAVSLSVLLLSLTTQATAEQIAVSKAGLVRFGETVVEPGGTYTAPDGHEVPAVISYTDESGNLTNYISLRQAAELFGANIFWDGTNVVLGKGGGKVTISSVPPEKEWPEAAVLGVSAGPFTEVDPAQVDTTSRAVKHIDKMEVRSSLGLSNQIIDCSPGATVMISITNHGEKDQYFTIYRKPAVSHGEIASFTEVRIRPGKTMVRAFTLAEDADVLTRELTWSIDGGRMTDITVDVTEYIP